MDMKGLMVLSHYGLRSISPTYHLTCTLQKDWSLSKKTIRISSVLNGFISFMYCMRLLVGVGQIKKVLNLRGKLCFYEIFIIKALTQVLPSLEPLLRHLLKYGSVCIGEGVWLQSGWAFRPWKPWVVLEGMVASSVTWQAALCALFFRHCLVKSQGLLLCDNLNNGKELCRYWRTGVRVAESAWA